MTDKIKIRRALLSVSDKTRLKDMAQVLADHHVEMVSTGGTARTLIEAGFEVELVEQVTGFPEMMDGRVKTLHPKIHGGLLALRDKPEHVAAMTDHGIKPIDLVCVNLYPFEQTVAKPEVEFSEAIEQIDIGGPSMVRSAAKNHAFVAIVTSADQYNEVINCLKENEGCITADLRRKLAAQAFARTAAYDKAIAQWFAGQLGEETAEDTSLTLQFTDKTALRYGENPHQAGAVYHDATCQEASVVSARQLHGKAISFCNVYDADGALELIKEIDPAEQAAVAVIKHANPCGFAVADKLDEAFTKAYAGDPLAAFGGIVACNRPIDGPTAEAITAIQSFVDVILAPGYDPAALEKLQTRWKNTRLLETAPITSPATRPAGKTYKWVTGGLLEHDRDIASFEPDTWEHKAGPAPSADLLGQMKLAMIAAKHLKSNAVCLVKDNMLIGAGAGQMDRVAACRIAVEKAGDRVQDSVVGSDAFFPFRDGPDLLIKAGVKAIVQPGGSMRDEETIQACEEAGITLVLTGRRHFRH